MKRMKKWCACLLCMTLLCSVMCLGAWPASAMEDISLLPADTAAYSAGSVEDQSLDGSFTVENGVLTIKSTGEDGYRVHIKVDQTVPLGEAVSLFTKLSCDVTFNIALVIESASGDSTWMGFASDFYDRFSLKSNELAIEAGEYERELDFSDACTYNVNIPVDECLIKEVQIAVKEPNGTMTLSEMKLADTVDPSPVIGEEGEDEDTDDTAQEEEADTAKTTATTKAAASAQSDSSSMTMWIVLAVIAVLVIAAVVVIVIVVKKKKAA
ncbi:MAG: hypothetical protein ACI39E_03485 [Acutalibacteraceae bacterium]